MSRTEVESCNKLEIWWLLKGLKNRDYRWKDIFWGKDSVGCLIDLISEKPYVKFSYVQTNRITDEKECFDYKVPLIQTSCHFGKHRHWFKCSMIRNGQYCGRRVGVLYKDGDFFACRHCHGLVYSSQNDNREGTFYSLFRAYRLKGKIKLLLEKTKHHTYRGEITRKQRKIYRLIKQLQSYRVC